MVDISTLLLKYKGTTMTEYKEQQLAGKLWTRGCRVIIDNPRNSTPTISVFEEKVLLVEDGSEITTPVGSFANDFNPEAVFTMFDPTTNQEMKGTTFSGQDLYNMVFSYYMNRAIARDEKTKK